MGKFTTSTDFISYKIQHNVRHGLKNIPRKGKSWYTIRLNLLLKGIIHQAASPGFVVMF